MAKKQATPKGRVEVLPPVQEDKDLVVVQESGNMLTAFLRSLVPFFTTAAELELKAKRYEEDAQQLVAPMDQRADELIQTFIKTGTMGEKQVEEHWNICQALSGLHRQLTARRGIATSAIQRGKARAQQLHNAYADEARRKAAAEQDRLRREAEEKARLDRERELADLEAKRVEAEEASADLSQREQAFVERYFETGDGIAAARYAGFADPAKQSARLLALPKILEVIEAKRKAKAATDQAAALRQQPLDVRVETVKAKVSRSSGSYDRTTWSAEILDAQAFVAAAVAGKHGIPLDCLVPDQTKLNEYARSIGSRMDLWPGVRAKKQTTTV